jgi:hypothetical protein
VVYDLLRHADSAGLGDLLEPYCHVHSIAVAVLTVDDDIADMDPDPHVDAPVSGQSVIASCHLALQHRHALHRIHHAAELG